MLPAAPDTATAKALAARDFDVLVDLAGTLAATLLAQRPAREIVTIGSLPDANATPIVDRTLADDDAPGRAWRDPCGLRPESRLARSTPRRSASCGTTRCSRISGATELRPARLIRACSNCSPASRPALLSAGWSLARRREQRRARRSSPLRSRRASVRRRTGRGGPHRARVPTGPAEPIALCRGGSHSPAAASRCWRALGLARARAARRSGGGAAFDARAGDRAVRRRHALQPRRRAADAARRAEAARAYQRALFFAGPDRGGLQPRCVLFRAGGRGRRGDRRLRDRAHRRTRSHVAAYRTWARCCSRREASTLAARTSSASRPIARRALPLAVQALEACQYRADFARLETYLEGLRREQFRPSQRDRAGRLPRTAAVPAPLFRRRAADDAQVRADLRRDRARASTASRCRVLAQRRPGTRARGLPVGGPAQSRDGQDDLVRRSSTRTSRASSSSSIRCRTRRTTGPRGSAVSPTATRSSRISTSAPRRSASPPTTSTSWSTFRRTRRARSRASWR